MSLRFSAVVLTHNRLPLLKETLRGVFAQTIPFDEVIVSDNNSVEGEEIKALIQKDFPSVRLLRHAQNLGFPKGMNRGFEACTGDWILFLADDIRLEPDFLERVKREIPRWPSAGLFSGKIVNPDGAVHFAGGNLEFRDILKMTISLEDLPADRESFKMKYAPGCLMLIRRDVFEALKGFDETIFLYYEDVDLCIRLLEKGHELVMVPGARVCHLGPGHIWKNREVTEGQDFAYYYFHFKHCSFPNLVLFLLRMIFSPGTPFKLKTKWVRYLPQLLRARKNKQ